MSSPGVIQSFLDDFNAKFGVWGIVFRDDRGKNTKTLLELDITPVAREQVLRELSVTDYYEGPKKDILYGGSDMWVFAKVIKGLEVYIKITLGFTGSPVICISFHVAEHPMRPLKK